MADKSPAILKKPGMRLTRQRRVLLELIDLSLIHI